MDQYVFNVVQDLHLLLVACHALVVEQIQYGTHQAIHVYVLPTHTTAQGYVVHVLPALLLDKTVLCVLVQQIKLGYRQLTHANVKLAHTTIQELVLLVLRTLHLQQIVALANALYPTKFGYLPITHVSVLLTHIITVALV